MCHLQEKCQVQDHINMQPEIDEKRRTILVDWLIKVHMRLTLVQETFYLTINIIDRFLSKEIVPLVELKVTRHYCLDLSL